MPLQGAEFEITVRTLKTLFRNCRLRKVSPHGVVYQDKDTLRTFCARNRDAIREWYASEFAGRGVTFAPAVEKLFKEN